MSLNNASTGQEASNQLLIWTGAFSCALLLLLNPLWTLYPLDLASLALLIIAIKTAAFRTFWHEYRLAGSLFIALVIINSVAAALPDVAARTNLQLLRGLIIFVPVLALNEMLEEKHKVTAAFAVTLISSVLGGLLLILLFTNSNAIADYRQLTLWSDEYFGNLHNLTNAAALTLISALVLSLRMANKAARGLMIMASFTSLLILWKTDSEGGAIALACTLGVAIFCLFKSNKILGGAALLGSSLLVFTLNLFYFAPEIPKEFFNISFNSFYVRVDIYQRLLEQWQSSPWFGFGAGTYKYLPASEVGKYTFLYPHHIFLEALFCYGVIGCLLLLTIFGIMSRTITLEYIRSSTSAFIALLVLCFMLVKGMGDMKFSSAHTITMITVALAMMRPKRAWYAAHVNSAVDQPIAQPTAALSR